jgi:DNA polymerase-3 subunit gamma/tau
VTDTVPHQALYRRWRAQTFGQIVGQEPVVTTLLNAVRSERVAHALLFVGPRGTGKTSLARIVAKALNCTDLRDGEPCDVCPSCVAIREGRALDVIEMDAASNNRVDDMRDLLARTMTAPSDLRRKVYIVDEVQRITQGWDVLLRTLEEPPEHVAFIFCTTDASQIRPAVLSRVQRFDFRRLTVEEIEGKLRMILAADGRAADDEAVELIARLAAGGMRDAESMLDQLLASGADRLEAARVRELLGLAGIETVDRFTDALVTGRPADGLEVLDELEQRGRDIRSFLDQVVDGLRTRLTSSLGDPARSAEVGAEVRAAERLAAIDPTRSGPGGVRLQLELALLHSIATEPSSDPIRHDATRPGPVPSAPATARDARPSAPAADRVPAPAPGPGSMRSDGSSAIATSQAAPYAEDVEPAVSTATSERVDEPGTVAEAPLERGRRRAKRVAGPADSTPTAAEARTDTAPADTTPTDAVTSPTPPIPPTRTDTTTPPISSAAAPISIPPTPPIPPAPADAATPTDAATLAALQDQWPEIVAYISQHPPTKPLVSACRPVTVDGTIVTLGFPEGQAFLKDVAERRRSNLEEGISHFLGRPVSVRLIATNVEVAAPVPADPEAARLIDEARRIFGDDLTDVPEVE